MEEKKSLGWWVVVIVVALVIIAFVVYYMRSMQYGVEELDTGTLKAPADTVRAIEKDLNALLVDNLDSELADIDKELAQ